MYILGLNWIPWLLLATIGNTWLCTLYSRKTEKKEGLTRLTTTLQRFPTNCISPVRQSTSQVRPNRFITLREVARMKQKSRVHSKPVLQDSGKLPRLGGVQSVCVPQCTTAESPWKHSAWGMLDGFTAEYPVLGKREV